MMSSSNRKSGIGRRSLELTFAGLLIGLSLLVLYDSISLGTGWGVDGPLGGYFPGRVGVVMLIGSLFVFWSGLKASNEIIISYDQLKSVLKVLCPLLVYIALIEPLGIYIPSALLIIVQMIMFGSFKAWQIVLGGVLSSLILFIVFETQFQVPLPKGPLETLLGY